MGGKIILQCFCVHLENFCIRSQIICFRSQNFCDGNNMGGYWEEELYSSAFASECKVLQGNAIGLQGNANVCEQSFSREHYSIFPCITFFHYNVP